MDIKNVKKIHFVGVKGVGMTPLAIIAKQAGINVTGSDVEEKFITDVELEKEGIKPFVGFDKSHIEGVDLVIATGAHGGLSNPEVLAAKEKNTPVYLQGEALGRFMNGEIFGKKQTGISIAGSHGKTTTTAILATILSVNKLDPSYVIGTGEIPSLGASGHFGKGNYFISEADEYFADVTFDKTPKFLYQKPKIILITNIDFDHPDIYPSIDELRKAFLEFLGNLPTDGALVACGDGMENRKFLSMCSVRKITYGISVDNDFILEKISFDSEKMFFWVKKSETILGQFSVNVFGEQNALNCLGAIVVSLEIGLSMEQIKKGLAVFKGTKRRSEFIGKLSSGSLLYDDYAHHPVEIKETLASFRKSFPKYKIVTIFQPHMYSRTKTLFNDFVHSFENSDEVLISEIFPSFREPVDKYFSSKQIVDQLKNNGKKATYFPKNSDVVKYLPSQNYPKNTVIITMGAGDIYKIGEEILNG
ncbi:MAG: UDP-N-acetylmuramate--L-alanine ligase [Bacteriovoracales bacterium]